jgi:hypothetical protein
MSVNSYFRQHYRWLTHTQILHRQISATFSTRTNLINEICCQTRCKLTVRIGCPAFQHYCILIPRINHCITTSCFLSETKIHCQQRAMTLSSQSHIIDLILYQTRCQGSEWRSFLASIIIANEFFIFWESHYHWLLFTKKRHVILSLISITSILTWISCIHIYWSYHGQRCFHTRA